LEKREQDFRACSTAGPKEPTAHQEELSSLPSRRREQTSENPRQQTSLKVKKYGEDKPVNTKDQLLLCFAISFLSERSKAHVFVDASFTHAILHTSSSIHL